MQFNDKNDEKLSHNSDWKSAFDATREVLLSLEVRRLIESMDASLKSGHGFVDSKKVWLASQLRSLNHRRRHLVSARLPWWSYIRNTFWVLGFLIKRKSFTANIDPNPEEFEKMDLMLGRAEFSARLSPAARNYLRQKIDNGELSRWTALSIIRSFGCEISKDGEISPKLVGKFALTIGLACSLALTIVFSTFAYVLGSELREPCVRGCIAAAAGQVAFLTGFLAAWSLALSLGRQRAATLLLKILANKDMQTD